MSRLLFVIAVLVSTPASALSMAGPPPPPLGWEESITPGFDPPIEETLVFEFHADEDRRKQLAESWGATAVPVFTQLHADPKWSEYKAKIQAYIALLGGPVAEEKLEQQVRDAFETMAGGESLDGVDLQAIFQIARNATDAMRDVVREIYASADEKNQSRMSHYVSMFAGSDRIAFLESCLPISKGENNRSAFEQYVYTERAQLRAREPMATILNRESAGEAGS